MQETLRFSVRVFGDSLRRRPGFQAGNFSGRDNVTVHQTGMSWYCSLRLCATLVRDSFNSCIDSLHTTH